MATVTPSPSPSPSPQPTPTPIPPNSLEVALARQTIGDYDGAIKAYRALLASTPPADEAKAAEAGEANRAEAQ